MRFVIFLFVFFFSLPCFGQDYSIKGKIVDLTTKEPVKNLAVRLFYEDYTKADTIKENIWLDLSGDKRKDTMYLIPKLRIVDSTWSDTMGNFYFSQLLSGQYSVHCRIRKLERGYQVDSKEHIVVKNDSVIVELTPKIFCEFDEFKNQNYCPICLQKDNCLKVIYGLPQYDPTTNGIRSKKDEYWIGYCEIDRFCFARWYCIKCDKLF